MSTEPENRCRLLESDVDAVCHIWALADEQDEMICHALTRYDIELFGTAGRLEVTRGAEVGPGPGGGETISYLCSWEIRRPDDRWASIVLSIEQVIEGSHDCGAEQLRRSAAYRVPDPGFFKASRSFERCVLPDIGRRVTTRFYRWPPNR